MANYKMILQYDGTRYRGWQVLPAELTIQGKLQDVLSKMAGYQVEVTGSGRTDAGVHAKGQTANFHLREEWDEDKILFYLNQYLPEDIAVCEVKRVDERFHSRYQAVEKTYLYRIHTGKIPEVFERRYVYDYTEPLDVNRMRKAAEYLCGTHDFKSFCGNKKMKKSTVRTISRIQIKELPGDLHVPRHRLPPEYGAHFNRYTDRDRRWKNNSGGCVRDLRGKKQGKSRIHGTGMRADIA